MGKDSIIANCFGLFFHWIFLCLKSINWSWYVKLHLYVDCRLELVANLSIGRGVISFLIWLICVLIWSSLSAR